MKTKHLALFLILIVFSLITEKMVPHVHLENGIEILPNFGLDKSQDQEEEDGRSESIHTSYYEPSRYRNAQENNFLNPTECIPSAFFEVYFPVFSALCRPDQHSFFKDHFAFIGYYSSKSPPMYT